MGFHRGLGILYASELRTGGLAFASWIGLADAGDIGAGPEVVVLGQAVGTEMQVMDAAFDGRLGGAALMACSSFCFRGGASTRFVALGPVACLGVKTSGGEDHAGGKEHGAGAKDGDVARRAKGRREETEAGEGEETSEGNHPASEFQGHSDLARGGSGIFGLRLPGSRAWISFNAFSG